MDFLGPVLAFFQSLGNVLGFVASLIAIGGVVIAAKTFLWPGPRPLFWRSLINEVQHYGLVSLRQPSNSNYCSFQPYSSSPQFRRRGITYDVSFTHRNEVLVQVTINGPKAENKRIFDALEQQKATIQARLGSDQVEWLRLDDKVRSRIALHGVGNIDDKQTWESSKHWALSQLRALNDVFTPRLAAVSTDSGNQ